jgi:HK97 family phage major capsid protein
MTLLEARTAHHSALTRADALVTAAETARRPLTRNETLAVDTAMAEARELGPMIATMERRQTLTDIGPIVPPTATATRTRLSASYMKDFTVWAKSGFTRASAALYEGSNNAGGFAVPSIVYGQIVQLAPPDAAIRELATVMPTDTDIHFPVQATAGSAALKPESGATANAFGGTNATLGTVLLSAFGSGVTYPLSMEIFQDVPTLLTFLSQDGVSDIDALEESLFIGGSGVGEAQGLVGNVGAGVSEAPDAAGNLVNPDGLLDLIGTVKAKYLNNASFLMQRATAILARKAQRQANLYEPVWTREGGKDYLHGYPVAYSAAMPAAAVGACPVLFGDFKRGYLVGQRGGPGLYLKVLDQANAAIGQVDVILFRRTDGRVRMAEAIQGYNIT